MDIWWQSTIPLTSDCVCLSVWVHESGWQRILLRRLLQRWRRAHEGRIQRKHCETGLFTQTGDGKIRAHSCFQGTLFQGALTFLALCELLWPGDSQTWSITGSQDKKLEGTEVHTEGRPGFHALLRPFKGNASQLRSRNVRPSVFTAILPFSLEWQWFSGLHSSPWFCGHSCGFRAWRWASLLSRDTSPHCHTATGYHPPFPFSFSAKKHGADGNFFEIITSNEVHYFLQAATSEERKDWIKAVQMVSKCGK